METPDVLQHIMDDSDYNISEGSSSDEEEDCAELHSSAVRLFTENVGRLVVVFRDCTMIGSSSQRF